MSFFNSSHLNFTHTQDTVRLNPEHLKRHNGISRISTHLDRLKPNEPQLKETYFVQVQYHKQPHLNQLFAMRNGFSQCLRNASAVGCVEK
jgi:hypothetical protein